MPGLIFSPTLPETRSKARCHILTVVHIPLRFWLIYRYLSLIVIYLMKKVELFTHPPPTTQACRLGFQGTIPDTSICWLIFWRGLSPRSCSLCIIALEGQSTCYGRKLKTQIICFNFLTSQALFTGVSRWGQIFFPICQGVPLCSVSLNDWSPRSVTRPGKKSFVLFLPY